MKRIVLAVLVVMSLIFIPACNGISESEAQERVDTAVAKCQEAAVVDLKNKQDAWDNERKALQDQINDLKKRIPSGKDPTSQEVGNYLSKVQPYFSNLGAGDYAYLVYWWARNLTNMKTSVCRVTLENGKSLFFNSWNTTDQGIKIYQPYPIREVNIKAGDQLQGSVIKTIDFLE